MAGIYKTIVAEDQEALFKIGSDKWKNFDNYFHSFADGMSKKNMNHSVLLNLANGKHACAQNCQYCNWRKHPLSKEFSCPGSPAIEHFLEKFLGYRVTVSGGGDPLYKYKGNPHLIKGLVESIIRLGFLPCLITREYEAAVSPEVQGIFHQISFSVEQKCSDVQAALTEILTPRKVVTIVYDPNKELGFYKDLYEFYTPFISHMIIRQDMEELWVNSQKSKSIKLKRNLLFSLFRSMNAKVQFLPAEACLNAYYFIANEEYTGHDLFNPA